MAGATLKGLLLGLSPVLSMAALLLFSLYLMSQASENTASFDQLYSLLLLVNALGIVGLAILIGINLWRLQRQLQQRVAGARLTARMLVMFVVLSVTPVVVVYFFSLQFLHQGIDSWFDVRVDQAMDDALALSRGALDGRMNELLRQTHLAGEELAMQVDRPVAVGLGELRDRNSATEMSMLSASGRIIASSHVDTTAIVPDNPDEAILLQVRQTGHYVGLDPLPERGVQIRVVVNLPRDGASPEELILQALYPVAERMNNLAESVQSAIAHYRELAYLREPLKMSFTLTLSVVLLLSLLTSAWAAFFSARRLAAPIQDLAEGTRAVAAGDYETQLSHTGSDDMAFLVRSFNDMTRRLSTARDEADRSRQVVEEQRTYLEAVLARLSSGVITFDHDHRLYTANTAACQILDRDLRRCRGMNTGELSLQHPHLTSLYDIFEKHFVAVSQDWREEVPIFDAEGRKILLCRGTPLAGMSDHVIVFDDVTRLIKAQKEAAWTEVARRLAHEIKNPLTPIQLSAERVRHKYLDVVPERERATLKRLTDTIVQQVESMKDMVNAFSSYARAPKMQPELLDINVLIADVLELYRYNREDVRVDSELAEGLPMMEADPGRMRQVLHNLIKNAQEAPGEQHPRVVTVTTRGIDRGTPYLEISVQDNGAGIPGNIIDNAFEPYVSTKQKGSGLGLAIVNKIVEEHGGFVRAENLTQGGARIRMRFPAAVGVNPPAGNDRGRDGRGSREHDSRHPDNKL